MAFIKGGRREKGNMLICSRKHVVVLPKLHVEAIQSSMKHELIQMGCFLALEIEGSYKKEIST